jgi:hypothetical protein
MSSLFTGATRKAGPLFILRRRKLEDHILEEDQEFSFGHVEL